MRRNVKNELVLAVTIIVVLGFAVAFAALLSTPPVPEQDATSVLAELTIITELPATDTHTPTATATATDTEVPTATVTNTATATATDTDVPTATATDTEVPTATATDTEAPTATATDTEAPTATVTDTDVPTATATDTEAPTATVTDTEAPTATVTDTDVPTAMATNTPQAEAQIAATDTPEPTSTFTATMTETSTSTATATATNTAEPTATFTATMTETSTSTATATATVTNTPEPTATFTATMTETSTSTATATLTPSPTATATATIPFLGILPTPPPSPTVTDPAQPTRVPSDCELPGGWVRYTVRRGDTLFGIALATNSTLDELRYVNCIGDVDNITVGEVVFVPRVPSEQIGTTGGGGVRPGLAAIGCRDPRTQITSPIGLQRISGVFTIYGTASRQDFWYYKIEVRPDWSEIYNFYMDSYTPASGGVIAQVNSEIFNDGVHWLRLSVVDLTANIQPDAICEIPVIFD